MQTIMCLEIQARRECADLEALWRISQVSDKNDIVTKKKRTFLPGTCMDANRYASRIHIKKILLFFGNSSRDCTLQ